MPLYEVAILEKPLPKEAKDGAIERLVAPPKAVVAADAQSAAIIVAMDTKEDFDKSRMVVLVRPFG